MQDTKLKPCEHCGKLHTRKSMFCSLECTDKNLEKYFVREGKSLKY